MLDHDRVDISNLHRQVIHCEKNQGKLKVNSAAERLIDLNSTCKYIKHPVQLSTRNAFEIVSKYDVVVDATDNVTTRYIVNDACVLARKPLVSGAAVSMDGQISVYNYKNSPCYRCRFPRPPKQGNVASCSDAGVLGPVPGLIGVLQSIEAIKILTSLGECMNGRIGIFDALDARFMVMKLNKRRENCEVCSTSSIGDGIHINQVGLHTNDDLRGDGVNGHDDNDVNVKKKLFKIQSLSDTLSFLRQHGLDNGVGEEGDSNRIACSFNMHKKKITNDVSKTKKYNEENKFVNPAFQHISCNEFYTDIWENRHCEDDNQDKNGNVKLLFLDVRAKHQYDICSLPSPFINIPYSDFDLQKDSYFKKYIDEEHNSNNTIKIYTLCRRGIASQRAANRLIEWGFKTVFNIEGGLEQWQKDVDSGFPLY